ncbi:MAG: hypothetical protein QOH06_5376 [Acidobacteriota bacterium]|jgi:hypothetical protein|nr:hypothetical protein [Acidobacteriota bacterium]
MSADLTRWNRAGLTRFRYVDGNALTFLEDLRSELAARFPEWEIQQRNYDEPSADWAWEIVRAFARACHVLGEHVDAYANEGYLRTASQWDSVRKLVAMLDVHPAPPASASTPLVIDAKDEPGTLAAGFAVRHTPKDGGAPVLFETLEELALDPALNALHLAGWNLSPAPLINLPPARPLSAIAKRSARVIQGVGPHYQAVLDPRAPLGSGNFTVADFRTFAPSELRLWEAKSKAEVLLDFPWTSAELAPLARRRLPELLFQTPAQLSNATGRDVADMARFLEDLRTAEIALDEEVFNASRLEDLLSPGAPPPDPPPLWAAPEDSGISAGQLAIVVRGSEQAAVVRIQRVEGATGEISLESVAHQPAWESWTRGVSSLLAKPKVIAVAHLAGSPKAVTFNAPHGLSAGDRVAWQSGANWIFADVEKADDLGLLVSGNVQPPAGAEVFHGIEVDGLSLPLGYRAAATPVSGSLQVLANSERKEEKDNNGVTRFFTVTRPNTSRVVFVPGGARPAGRVSASAPAGGDGKFRFGGKPGELESGQWVVGDDRGRLLALRIERIEELEDHFAVTFESVVEPAPHVATRPVSILMGVGPAVDARLRQAQLDTVGKLAAIPPTLNVPGLTRTTRFEVRAKAQLVTSFPFEERDLEPILDLTIPQVLAKTQNALADDLGKPSSWAAELLEKLRLMQAVIDEPPLSELRVRDLLPIGAPRPVADYQLNRLDRLYGVFEHTIRPSGWDVNDTPVSGARLSLELAPPSLLARGRRLVVERAGLAREASLVAVDPAARTLDLTPPLTAEEGFTLGNLVLRANVVRGGHGEAKPAKVLGSGDAARRSQSFVLKEKDVAFVADPTQPAGVAAAVQVIIAGQTWLQVATLRDSRPSDPHYEVQLTEDGYLAFTFGDGLRGRRLPTGTNNVRVSFRVGTGLAGNLPPGSLTKPARPNPRVDAVSQPLDATGGNDREDVASLKSQAPKSVLTLERAVSLSDFGALAGRQASVWQAKAFALPTGGGRYASVEVVVVPAGGGPLGPLAADLTSFLTTNALPGIDLRVSAYEPKPFDLEVEIEVKSAEFDRDEVRKSVETALLDTFGLRRRALGASLFTSELYEVVEGVPGVESSRVSAGFGNLMNQRVLSATDRQVIFLDPSLSRFSVTVREFEL